MAEINPSAKFDDKIFGKSSGFAGYQNYTMNSTVTNFRHNSNLGHPNLASFDSNIPGLKPNPTSTF